MILKIEHACGRVSPPALMKIVHQETLIENGVTIKIIKVLQAPGASIIHI
jgi:hypothetical protein